MTDSKIIRLSSNPKGFGLAPDQLERDMFASDMPVQHTHLFYEDDELGLYVGLWDTTEMLETPGPYSCDEFMWILEGQVEIKNCKTGVMERVQAGEAFVIPKGYDCQWHQHGYLRKFFFISEHPDEEMPAAPTVEGIVKLPSLSGELNGGNTVCYRNNSGKFRAGIWQSEPFESALRPMPHDELVYMIEGTLRLSDEGGTVYNFSAGDAFFIPKGTLHAGTATMSVRMFYAALECAATSD